MNTTTAATPSDTAALVADIGGTHIRLGWVAAPGAPVQQVHHLRVADFAAPLEAVQFYLDGLRQTLGADGAMPRQAAWAVATPLTGDLVQLTNGPWRFSVEQTRRALGLTRLALLNDFEALALALPGLGATQWRSIGAERPVTAGVLAVIGPGTGLGVAGVVPTANGWSALPTEGGHATLAPADDFESAVLAAVRRSHAHVSAERLLSGLGLPTLHRAVAQVLGRPATDEADAATIIARSLSGQCPLCERVVDTFCAMLGGFAGNVALTLGARGGVYVGGGIVPRLGERFERSAFRDRFEAKGRYQDYLRPIATRLITDTDAALAGAALALRR